MQDRNILKFSILFILLCPFFSGRVLLFVWGFAQTSGKFHFRQQVTVSLLGLFGRVVTITTDASRTERDREKERESGSYMNMQVLWHVACGRELPVPFWASGLFGQLARGICDL